MKGVGNYEAVVQWRERGEALLQSVRGRSKRGAQLAEQIVERLVSQENDIEAFLALLVQERERKRSSEGGTTGVLRTEHARRRTERLRDYAVSIRLREVAFEKKLNGEHQKVARLEVEPIQAAARCRELSAAMPMRWRISTCGGCG